LLSKRYRFNDPNGKQLGLSNASNGNPNGMFTRIPNGLPGVETRMPLLFSEGVLRRKCIDIKRFVELTSENPAKLYGLYPKKGAIQIGSDADIVIWYRSEAFRPRILNHDRDLHDGCDYSPYEGIQFLNWPRMTILRGKVMFRDGEVVGKRGFGEFAKRKSCALPLRRKMEGVWDVLHAAV
jgi:dihydropyrimidinase